MQRRRRVEDDLALLQSLTRRGDDLAVLVEWANAGEDVAADLTRGLEELRQQVEAAETKKMLGGEHDRANAIVTIDLENQEIKGPDGGMVKFEIDAFRKKCLLEGLDEVGQTMQSGETIEGFEAQRSASQPWLVPSIAA